jgi:hypothetical protein
MHDQLVGLSGWPMLVCLVRKLFFLFAQQMPVRSRIIKGACVNVIAVGEEGLESIV